MAGAFVQYKAGYNSYGTSASLTFDAALVASRLVHTQASAQGDVTLTLTDSLGNTPALIGTKMYDAGADISSAQWLIVVSTAGTSTLTVSSSSGTPDQVFIQASEWSGLATVSPLLPGAYSHQLTNNGTGADAGTSGYATISTVPAFAVSYAYDTGGSIDGVGTGWTLAGNTADRLVQYQRLTSTGSYQATNQDTNYNKQIVGIAIFAEAPTGPTFSAQPADQTVNVGATATFTVADNATSRKWQDDRTGSFVDISGETGTSLTFSAVSYSLQGRQVRAIATDSNGNTTSSTATLRVAYTLTGTGPQVVPLLGAAPFGAGPFGGMYRPTSTGASVSASDSVTATDAPAASYDAAATLTDTATLVEALSGGTESSRASADTLDTAEVFTGSTAYTLAGSDALSGAEAASGAAAHAGGLLDTLSAAEFTLAGSAHSSALTDSQALAEACYGVSAVDASAADLVAPADHSAVDGYAMLAQASDVADASETVISAYSVTVSLLDTVDAADSGTGSALLNLAAADTLTTEEALIRAFSAVVSLSDFEGVLDASASLASHTTQASDDAQLSEALGASTLTQATLSDAESVADGAQALIDVLVSAQDAAQLSDSATYLWSVTVQAGDQLDATSAQLVAVAATCAAVDALAAVDHALAGVPSGAGSSVRYFVSAPVVRSIVVRSRKTTFIVQPMHPGTAVPKEPHMRAKPIEKRSSETVTSYVSADEYLPTGHLISSISTIAVEPVTVPPLAVSDAAILVAPVTVEGVTFPVGRAIRFVHSGGKGGDAPKSIRTYTVRLKVVSSNTPDAVELTVPITVDDYPHLR